MGSDRLVHLSKQTAAAAWFISHNNDEYTLACVLISKLDITLVSSYQTEPKGVFCMKHAHAHSEILCRNAHMSVPRYHSLRLLFGTEMVI